MSTIQVDRIIPYQSSSVTIEGDVTVLGAATTGSNTFVGEQNFTEAVTASVIDIQQGVSGNGINLYQDGTSQIRFWSGSNQTEVGSWVNMQVNPVNGAIAISSFPSNNHFLDFEPTEYKSRFSSPVQLNGGIVGDTGTSGSFSVAGNLDVSGITTFTNAVTISNDLTINQNLNVQSGNINGRDIILDDPGSNSTLLFNPDYFTAYRGIIAQWQEGVGKSYMNIGEQTAEILLNGVGPGFSYDTALILQADSGGAKFRDWNAGGGYAYQTWLAVAPLGNPSFQRTVEVTGSVEISSVLQLAGQDPLPAGAVGQLAVSSSGDLYYHNGSGWQLK